MNRAICLTFALATIAVAEASAEPNKEQYELQERCGKRAAEIFKSEYGGGGITNTDDGQNITTYQNHYSANYNKCFFLQIVTGVNYTKKIASTSMTLFDLSENKDYGTFFKPSENSAPLMCNVRQKPCHSQGEWEELLKPYMEQ